jgi:hypothetical protein
MSNSRSPAGSQPASQAGRQPQGASQQASQPAAQAAIQAASACVVTNITQSTASQALATASASFGSVSSHRQNAIREHPSPPALGHSGATLPTVRICVLGWAHGRVLVLARDLTNRIPRSEIVAYNTHASDTQHTRMCAKQRPNNFCNANILAQYNPGRHVNKPEHSVQLLD